MGFQCPHKRINDDRTSAALWKYVKDPKAGLEEAGPSGKRRTYTVTWGSFTN
jgi:hypothetical protein